MSISEATPEKGFLAMDTFERPLSIVASEMDNKATLRKKGFITLNTHLIFPLAVVTLPPAPRVIFQPHDLEKILYDIKNIYVLSCL